MWNSLRIELNVSFMKNDPAKGGNIRINGIDLCWSVAHRQGWANTGGGQKALLGFAVLVERKTGAGRPLLLQFEPSTGHRNMPDHQRLRINAGRLSDCIQNAIAAGWDPESRGKQFVFQAGLVD